jgi:hypothetical protein
MAPQRVPGRDDVDEQQDERDRHREHRQLVPFGVAVPSGDRGDEEERHGEGDEGEGGQGRRAVEPPRAAESEGKAEHEQQVPDDGAGQRAANDLGEPVVDGEECDDELRSVAERGIEKATDSWAGVVRGLLGGIADEPRERNERDRREDEDEDLARAGEAERDHDWREHEAREKDASDHGVGDYPSRVGRPAASRST